MTNHMDAGDDDKNKKREKEAELERIEREEDERVAVRQKIMMFFL